MTDLPEIRITPADNLLKPPGQGGSGPWGASGSSGWAGSGNWGSSGAGWGGIADAVSAASEYPSGTPLGAYFGPGGGDGSGTGSNRLVPASQAGYYSGYWAGVQGALYGFGPPAAPPIHSFGFATDVIERIAAPRTSDLPTPLQGLSSALQGARISHPMEMWLTPDQSSSWFFGNNADDWPTELPDWGARPSGPIPPMSVPSPISGRLSDFPTALKRSPQLVNPELGPSELDPNNFVGPYDVERLIFDTIRPMTNADALRIGHTEPSQSVATPGNIISDLTPPNLSSNIFPGNPDTFPGLLSPNHGPATSFILLDW